MATGAQTKSRVTILLGSLRAGSNSARIAALVGDGLRSQGADVEIVDPRQLDLKVPGHPAAAAENEALGVRLKAQVAASDAVVLVTPEYDGSYSAVLKILIEHLGYPSALQGKPVALIGVASGAIGALKALEHLRGICLHIGALVMPTERSFGVAHRLFDADGACKDSDTEAASAAYAEEVLAFVRWVGGA